MTNSLEDEIEEWYGGKIRSGLSENESLEDIIRATALLSKQRAEREKKDSPSEEDIEWALGILCFLPLMPKDEESTKIIRQVLFKGASDHNNLPVSLYESINYREDSLLDLQIRFPTPGANPTPIREAIEHHDRKYVVRYVEEHRSDLYEEA